MPRVLAAGIPLDATLPRIEQVVREHSHTRYPVHKESLDHVIGSAHVRNLLGMQREGRALAASDLRSVPFVPHTSPLEDVLETLRVKRARKAVVMDEHGGNRRHHHRRGSHRGRGERFRRGSGRHDPPAPRGRDGGMTVPATTRLDEHGERVGIRAEHEEVDTVSGLVLARLERPPFQGVRRVQRIPVRGGQRHRTRRLRVHRDAGSKRTSIARIREVNHRRAGSTGSAPVRPPTSRGTLPVRFARARAATAAPTAVVTTVRMTSRLVSVGMTSR